MASAQSGKEGAVSAAVEALRKAMMASDRSALEQQGQWKLLARQAAKL